jgi:nitrite reductase (NO-forming)
MKKLWFSSILALTLMTVNTAFSCPWCNNKFYNELVGERAGSLVSKELLAAIMNQSSLYPAPVGAGSNNYVAPVGSTITPPDQNRPEGKNDFIEIISRDNRLSIPPTSYVPQDTKWDKEVTIELSEGETYIGKGVMFKGFVTNGMIPGPTIIVDEGDVVKFNVVNKGTVPHGASIHSAYTQTSKYLGKIGAGETKSIVFRVTYPGVYLYHCAPGGHAIPMHILFGQYGMMVVRPKKQYKLEQILNKKPDVEIFLLQHEIYSSGKDAIEGKPIYVAFNGKLFRYVEEPIKAKPGDYVRINFLNAGPNLLSTFHIVGIIWDFAYWQGNPDVSMPGGQSVLAGPTDSWVVEFRMPPDEGAYLMLSHAVGSTDRGAIGILACDKNAQTPLTVMSDGPKYSEQEFADLKSKVTRVVSPFEPGTPDVDPVEVYGPESKEVTVKIIGNSYYPKRIQIAEGTTVKWINEDVFAYMEGEFAGIHNAISYEGPENFQGPLLAHGEVYKFTFSKEGNYKYMCTPHPYMRGEITVGGEGMVAAGRSSNLAVGFMGTIAGLMLLLVGIRFFEYRTNRKNGVG